MTLSREDSRPQGNATFVGGLNRYDKVRHGQVDPTSVFGFAIKEGRILIYKIPNYQLIFKGTAQNFRRPSQICGLKCDFLPSKAGKPNF